MKVLGVLFLLVAPAISFPMVGNDTDTSDPDPVPPVSRIVGGYPVSIQQFPYQVYLLIIESVEGNVMKGNTCGGSIITNRHILSAAHCFIKSNRGLIRYGSSSASGGTEINFSRVKVHEFYSSSAADYDIAIVFLDSQIQFSNAAQPISLFGESYTGTAVVSGWGKTTTGGSSPDLLRATQLRIVECTRDIYRYAEPLTDRMMCAVPFIAGIYQGTCQGDSGGPVVMYSNGNPVQIGIVSFGGLVCGHPNQPSIFTNVSKLIDWIVNHVN